MDHSKNQLSTNNLEIDDLENSNRIEEFDDTSSLSEDEDLTGTNVIQWLQALDLQVIGACRVDERLKPLLKLNVSTGAAEDRLLAHLNQNFEPAEVGMLARCLCIPLVSMRVGKIMKQGTLLCPTAARGNLKLTILPSSELCISFIGDDGITERIGIFSSESDCAAVEVKDIMADKSGRSFLISIPDGETFYFWCSEKSKLLGDELRRKMRDLLKRKPSLAELTGIDESRLDCFAFHLRAYLFGSTATNAQSSSSGDPLAEDSDDSFELGLSAQIPAASQRPLRSQHFSGLSSMTSAVKDSMLANSSVCFPMDRRRRHGDSTVSLVDNQIGGTSVDAPSSTSVEEDNMGRETSPSNILEPLVAASPFLGPAASIPSLDSTVFSPYYCWCPPTASALQYSVGTPNIPILSMESVPLLSSIPPTFPPGTMTATPLLFTDVSSLDFPPLLPERLPISLATSQQIPSFTPLMCDPIVHVPVIDICSSGQGYLVSAGPAISSTIPTLHRNLMKPTMQETESMVEQSARETLRLLINSSSQSSPQLIDLLPPVISRSEEAHNMLTAGSRGLYSGTIDVVDTIASGFAFKGLVSLPEKPLEWINKKQISIENLILPMEKQSSSDESSVDEGCTGSEVEKKN